jgi:hypothetical protein
MIHLTVAIQFVKKNLTRACRTCVLYVFDIKKKGSGLDYDQLGFEIAIGPQAWFRFWMGPQSSEAYHLWSPTDGWKSMIRRQVVSILKKWRQALSPRLW